MKVKCYIEMVYSDESEFGFYVEVEGSENEIHGELLMITRGTLMACGAAKGICYREDGFEVCSYIQ